MPIRHCQKCGLKVLIDESQTTQNPFYCQRCTASLKSEPRPEAKAETPVGASSAAAKKADGGTKPAMVKVNCPYCKASFNGRIPQKPARGACPVCQKELILLPTGEIRSAVGFDVNKWTQEGDLKKFAAPAAGASEVKAPTRTAAKSEESSVSSSGGDDIRITEVLDEPAPAAASAEGAVTDATKEKLPSWLDDETTNPSALHDEPKEEVRVSTEEAPAPEPPVEVPVDVPNDDPLPAAAEEPPPPPPEPEPEAAAKPSLGTSRRPLGTRRLGEARGAALLSAPAPTGMGKVILAFLFFALPLAAGPVISKSRDKFEGPLTKIGTRYANGFKKIYEKYVAPPAKVIEEPKPAPPPPEEKKEEPKPGAQEQQLLKDEMDKLARQIQIAEKQLRQDLLVATEAQKADLKKVEDDVKKKREKVTELQQQYKTLFKEDYDPYGRD